MKWPSVVILSLLASVVPISTVQATHSVPQPYIWFWDLGNDGTPDGAPAVDAAGSGWTTGAVDRLKGAIGAWANGTSFNPHYVDPGSFKVYRDGTGPACNSGVFNPGDYAGTCVYATLRHLPGAPPDEYYHDISSAATYAQTDANLPGSVVRYWYGSGQSPYSGDLDFQGIMTHELGHWIRLADLGPDYGLDCNYGSGIYTMCGELQDPGYHDQSYWQRTLTSDDVNAANVVY